MSTHTRLFVLLLLLGQSAITQNTAEPRQPGNTQGGSTRAVPAGTVLQIRLRQTISSFGSKRDTPVSAMLIAPVEAEGRTVLPLGSKVEGTLRKIRRVGLGLSRETAFLDIAFESITLPNGQMQALKAQVIAVDDARESVDSEGRIHGIRATASFSSVLSGAAVSAASVDPMLLGFALSSSLSIFRIPESEIILSAGAELRVRLKEALPITGAFGTVAPPVIHSEDERIVLTELIRPLPFRTATDKTGTPSDLTSLLYIGSENAIVRAFGAAGWVRSDRLSDRSKYGAMRSVLENQGYREAPMSTLLLNGIAPAFTYSKTLNTFFKRHHLRIYGQPRQYRGLPVWTSTATHDSGIAFSRNARTLIHLIDENIDQERSKIVNDLVLTGCVDGVDYVDRPWIPRDAKNATGDSLITDGRIAVILLNDCGSPARADEPDSAGPRVRTKEAAPLRPFRDTLLTLRNDFSRGNIGYQAYSGVRTVGGMLRRPSAEASHRSIHYGGEEFHIVPGSSAAKIDGAPRDPGQHGPTFHDVAERPSLATILDFSFSGGYSRFGNSRFSTQPITFTLNVPPPIGPIVDPTDIVTDLHNGWGIAPRITLNSWKHVSNEFGFAYNRTSLSITAVSTETEPTYDSFNAQVRQFTYNALIHLRPNGSRFRPYAAVGPAFQLIRTVDSKPHTNSLLKFAVRDLGLIVGAYEFGTKPPLEGGGIFQMGLQYGGGFKVQLSPRFFVRLDFRETLSHQPDFWTASYPTIRAFGAELGDLLTFDVGKLQKHGPLRQQLFSMGVGISF